ncbi:MAG: endo-1,4-beta-xylanase [Treponema sp.]|nr:endo-1,4-beta-xylanase [Treponema sp.]
MKKHKLIFASAFLLLCAGLHAAPAAITRIDEDKKAIKFGQKADGFKDVTVVKGSACTKQNPISVNLEKFANQEVTLSLSCDIKIKGADGDFDIIWMINDYDAGFPEISRKKIKGNEWVHMQGKKTLIIGKNKQLYLSKTGLPMDDISIMLKDFKVEIITEGDIGEKLGWLEAPSLKKALNPYFTFGLAVTYKGELTNPDIQDGLFRHAETITLGNEFKPDFLFAWQNPNVKLTQFTASNGKTIDVPALLPSFKDMDAILGLAQINKLKIRGHVLTWHSQTPHWFFTEGYKATGELVDKETMTARHEWYIASVLNHVKAWEEKYNKGEHIIWVWDVVNEAAKDGATADRWLREDSDWYRIYGDAEFIVNAFRFANKYAPADVLLCYNDYGTYSGSNLTKGGKTNAILNIIDAVQAAPDARLDVLGMQSHVGLTSPKATGSDSFETAVQKFVAKGLDVHVTELDVGHTTSYSPIKMKARYYDLFKVFLANRKTEDKHGISCVTIWGVTDENTWLDNQPEYKNKIKQHPVLFDGKNEFFAKPCFYGILEAVEEEGK